MNPLDRTGRWHGIPPAFTDASGQRRHVPAATRRALLAALGADPDGPPPAGPPPDRGMRAGDARCFLPPWLSQAPAWGLFCQLYELRSGRNWGIGDFRDLADLARIAAAAGADFLGVNPLHALFLAAPERCSPFSPSNRTFLNPLYIAVDEVPGAGPPPHLVRLRSAEMVDYPAVTRLKLAALRDIFARQPFADDAARQDHAAFTARRGAALHRHALFEGLSLHMAAQGHGAGWTGWPADYHAPDSAAVRDFAARHAPEIAFHAWLQWLADRQLAAAQATARAAGMRIGLYLDLAVGEAPDGSSAWDGQAMLRGFHIGAPPDLFQSHGQNWGLAAPSPAALEAADFAPFRAMIRAQLAHAGALRMDHAMALWQLFLVPEGAPAARGAYLRFPMRAMLSVLAAESQRARAMVIGEDLGSVPRGFRGAMARAGVLSYRVLYFEQTDAGFIAPERYPQLALACLSTHDLPTLADWWQGADITQRADFGLVDAETTARHHARRAEERRHLMAALHLPGPVTGALPDHVLEAAHGFIARSRASLVAVRLADLAGPQAPTNVPGTLAETYPNWRLRSPTAIEDLPGHPRFRAVMALMSRERPHPRL
ncbi:4-alpha-glucanotransferase [Pontibaca methylaminivorans]|uniref:4-alpha-glucanotransferase n=1 Tax=Pontibaca methylaminivorans TaxID=515897 RepID=A0A1R3X6Y6_9RHOB|nr:4-alpha-glucanotransferase [Pontibaca methylaminivorans]SIT86663.1 4-alpha-glucanotransferase [Pontibaca methylaminivorans]